MSDGRAPNTREQRLIDTARRTAADWCAKVVTRLQPLERFRLGSGDPRLAAPNVPGLAALFLRHFKSADGSEVRDVRDAYAALSQFLAAQSAASFRVVPDAEADREEEGDTYGFVRPPEKTIFLADRFFAELNTAPVRTHRSARSEVGVGPGNLNDEQKARVLVHEAAHARLMVLHSGGKFGTDLEACGTGHTVRSFRQAFNNAYCYDLFAYCLAQAPQ